MKPTPLGTFKHPNAQHWSVFVLCQLMVSVVEEISFDVCNEIGADRTFVGRVFDSCSIETLVGHTKRGVEDRSAVSAFQKKLI